MTGTDPEQLRQSIARAAIPLMGEYETLTTARIAQAVGISEADLLAVFTDKEAVMQASIAMLTEVVSATFDPAEEVRKIGIIRTDQPLASRLVEVIDILDAYDRRIRVDLDELLPVVPATGAAAGTADAASTRPATPQDEFRSLSSRSSEIREAVLRLLEPDQRHLRFPAQVLAAAFVGMVFSGVRPAHPDQTPLQAEQIVDLFLHGAQR